jgi:hypothetical protein
MSSGSMHVYGPLLSQALAKYPTTIQLSYATRVIQFLGDQEQRFQVRGELFSATLQFKGMNGYDTSVIRTFFRSMGGMATSVDLSHTFSITIASNTYNWCVFDQDELTVEIDRLELSSFELKIKQLRPN